MSEKGGLGAIPVFPQNMLAVKEDNPRRFYGQVCYLVWWFVLLSLFIVYASFNLKDYLELQDNPVITSRIKRAKNITYPLFLVCPFKAQADPDFKIYGLFPEENWYDGLSNDQRALIDTSGGLKSPEKGKNEENNKKGDGKGSKKDDLNLGNTGSIFPAEKDCNGDWVIKKPQDRVKANELQNKVADNIQAVLLKSLAGAESIKEPSKNEKDKNDAAYYTCLLFNAERDLTDEDRDRLGNPFSKSDDVNCKLNTGKVEKNDKDDKSKDKDGQRDQAYATDIGYFDGYVMIIRSYWKYDDDDLSGPNEGTVLGLSISIVDKIEELEPTAAEYSSIGIPVGVSATLTLKRIEFQCETCDDDELSIFYNATVNIIDLHEYPAVPGPRRGDNSLSVKTVIQVFYQSMTITSQREVITQGVLDYLGNFAGMCGTLLAFSVLGSVDRLCSYVFVGNGAKASVWDD